MKDEDEALKYRLKYAELSLAIDLDSDEYLNSQLKYASDGVAEGLSAGEDLMGSGAVNVAHDYTVDCLSLSEEQILRTKPVKYGVFQKFYKWRGWISWRRIRNNLIRVKK